MRAPLGLAGFGSSGLMSIVRQPLVPL